MPIFININYNKELFKMGQFQKQALTGNVESYSRPVVTRLTYNVMPTMNFTPSQPVSTSAKMKRLIEDLDMTGVSDKSLIKIAKRLVMTMDDSQPKAALHMLLFLRYINNVRRV